MNRLLVLIWLRQKVLGSGEKCGNVNGEIALKGVYYKTELFKYVFFRGFAIGEPGNFESDSGKAGDSRHTLAGPALQETTNTPLSSLPFWFYFIAFTSAELLTSLVDPLAGFLSHGLILVTLVVESVFMNDGRARNLVIALTLVPLTRIVSLSMPLANLPQVYWYLLIYAPLLVAAILVMTTLGLKPSMVGLVRKGLPLQIGIGLVLGIGIGAMEYYILRPKSLVAEFSLQQVVPSAIILLVTSGLVEELIFRGVLQRISEAAMGRSGLIYVSAIFAVLHIGHLSIADVAFVFIVATAFAFLVKRTGSLVGVILAHGLTNTILYLIAPSIFTLP